MTLRDLAVELENEPTALSKIDRLLVDHPDRTDEILDLLLGEPRLQHLSVARVLSREFGTSISDDAVRRWRSKL